MSNGIEFVEVMGWPLARLEGAEEVRILDVDLAERLGYKRPSDIRELIGRLSREGILNDSELLRTVRESSGRPAHCVWLTE